MSAVIKPGDQVLMSAPFGIDAKRVVRIAAQLEQAFPGVRFVIVAGLRVEGVIRAEDVA